MLLDEPFSALDALTRIEMHSLVTQLWERHQPAILLVTHDVDEALALADRVLVLDEGRVAREWEVPVRRTARSPEHHQIAQLREQVLGALGVHVQHPPTIESWSSMSHPSRPIRPFRRRRSSPAPSPSPRRRRWSRAARSQATRRRCRDDGSVDLVQGDADGR